MINSTLAQSNQSYDFFESSRQINQWIGATAKAFWGNPAFALASHPLPATLAAWGKVTEHAFDRVDTKPDWGIDTIVTAGRDYVVNVETLVEEPFCDLIQFKVQRRPQAKRRVLIVTPLSGHHATLTRKTVLSLLPNCEIFVTDWKNARDIPVSKGKFDIEDYTMYLVDFMQHLGPDLHVIAICQPAPLALAATAWMAENDASHEPRTLTLIGGPIDPDANATEVTDFGRRITMGQLERHVILPVGATFAGVGRKVYPGAMQLASFISMNMQTHVNAYVNQIFAVAGGADAEHDRHNTFYDEYLSVLDMTAEFYLSTVKRIFKDREIARNDFTINGKRIDIGKIKNTAVKTVEGARDDISAPGQCAAALDLLTGLKKSQKASYVAPDAGHYGIFSGKPWRNDIRPMVLDFIDKHSG
ncbi:MAG: polyhydroxyalkanoate depolymerase [Rhodobacteraceae bacterium]|nr:polyhydroxyalkanoate depolymerase [Paracoccaceae bacterium]